MESNLRKRFKNGSGLGAFSLEKLQEEIYKRGETVNPFPLDVFNEKIKPFINAINDKYDVPSSFIGLSLLSCYSTAIGTAFTVTTNKKDHFYLPIWGALTGLSSSGKSLGLNIIYAPLNEIQAEFDLEWNEKIKGLSEQKINQQKLNTVVYRDAHIPTLVKAVMPDNPKGLVKMSDELLEWINGMNQLSKKEGTDEQFWISSWNCAPYSGIRSGKNKFVIPKPYVNVIGGAQYKIIDRFFSKDRDTTGFIFRLLFALPEVDKIAQPDPTFEMPDGWSKIHADSIRHLYKGLPVVEGDEDPRRCVIMPEATKLYMQWTNDKIKEINAIKDLNERDINSGILGKIKEYILRFSAILHLADCALRGDEEYHNVFRDLPAYFSRFKREEQISKETMLKAIKLGDYFFTSAIETYNKVQVSMTAPIEVLTAATMLKMGRSIAEIANALWRENDAAAKQRAWRHVKKWIKEYPRVFNAVAK